MPQQNHYHISFFKPTTDSARRNRNMVVQLVLIWAIGIFGFQLLLKLLEKPTPEPVYLQFEKSWANITSGQQDISDFQMAGQAALSVLGKVAIAPEHRTVLDHAVSWMAITIADADQERALRVALGEFEQIAAVTSNITDPEYIAKKNRLIPLLAGLFNLDPQDVRGKIAPLEVKLSMMESLDADSRNAFEEAMGLYLVHNRSVLTDTIFLGFPFHYFYTAVFLLVLFVGLCWLYCVRTDYFNRKYGIED
jgi:putative solute:sodium symporter small subunit